MSKSNRLVTVLAACGAVCGLTGIAAGSANENNGGVIQISGATLFFNFFASPNSTTDFIDVDKDGDTIVNNPFNPATQLASSIKGGVDLDGSTWFVIDRSTGSGNGFAEFVDFSPAPDQTPDDSLDDPEPFGLSSLTSENSLLNRTFYDNQDAGGLLPLANINHPGACPVVACVDPDGDGVVGDADDLASPLYNRAAIGLTPQTGMYVDLSTTDVPSSYFVTIEGEGGPFASPATTGYGNNAVESNPSGLPQHVAEGGQSNKLKSLTGVNGTLNLFQPGVAPDAGTIFDTPVAFSPISPLTNLGTGLTQITYTDQQYSLLTGRFSDGRNFIQITRDSGSGTRNGFNNGYCLDPSWCIGDNIGVKTNDLNANDAERAGAVYQPNNKNGSGTLEDTIENTRIGIGYSGTERGGDWLLGGKLEILAVKNDFIGDENAQFVRPTLENLIFNSDPNTSYRAGAVQTFGSLGDPRAEPVEDGGDANGNPAMRNKHAAAYLNNITRSIEAFEETGDPDQFSPGQFLGFNFILTAAADFVQDTNQPCVFIPNPVSEQTRINLQNAVNTPQNLLNDPGYETFGTYTQNGRVPFRLLLGGGESYSDGVAGGQNYITQSGGMLAYGTPLNDRNRIAFDFDGDFDRDSEFDAGNLGDSDIFQAIAAWNQRNGDGSPWTLTGNGDACIEILGDLNMTGDFDADDIRYWADGLVMDGGAVSRELGFTLVDQAWDLFNGEGAGTDNNFFGTTLATGAAYTDGASRADVAGNSAVTPGWAPTGWDGTVDGADIDYVYANFGDWSDVFQAINMDLSADMNGDLVVNQDDVCIIVNDILGTQFGDVDLDGDVDGDDLAIINGNLGMTGGWADGDLNGDGSIDSDDLDIANGVVDPCAPPSECAADIDGSGSTTSADLNILLGNFGEMVDPGTGGDFDGSGTVDSADLNVLLGDFGCGS